MKHIFLLFITCLVASSSFSQDIEFQININTPKLQTTDPKVFESLANSIRDFVDNVNWSDDEFETEERIKCSVQLTIREELSANTFSADMAIQAVRPVYGSSYETILLSHVDKDVSFQYEQYQPLIYSRNSYKDNLTSILSFYINIILGMDYDSFSPFGGEVFFAAGFWLAKFSLPAAVSDGLFSLSSSLDGSSEKSNRTQVWCRSPLEALSMESKSISSVVSSTFLVIPALKSRTFF